MKGAAAYLLIGMTMFFSQKSLADFGGAVSGLLGGEVMMEQSQIQTAGVAAQLQVDVYMEMRHGMGLGVFVNAEMADLYGNTYLFGPMIIFHGKPGIAAGGGMVYNGGRISPGLFGRISYPFTQKVWIGATVIWRQQGFREWLYGPIVGVDL